MIVSFMLQLVCFATITFAVISYSDYCRCSWFNQEIGQYLDLTKFVTENIKIESNGWSYTPCNDQLQCGSYDYQLRWYSKNRCQVSAWYNPDNEPIFKYENNITSWTFNFDNLYMFYIGNYYLCQDIHYINISIIWICDGSIFKYPYYKLISIKSTSNNRTSCSYEIIVNSSFACPVSNIIPPTDYQFDLLSNRCIFNDAANIANYTLNLTSLNGEEMLFYGYYGGSYTVCMNGKQLQYGRFPYDDNTCVMFGIFPGSYPAAFWDSSVKPIYYEQNGNKTWLFHYEGAFIDFPESCHPNTYIYWICNYNAVPYITDPLDCDYHFEYENISCDCNVTISSAYACPDCIFHDSNYNGYALNVNALRYQTIDLYNTNDKYLYLYTPCWNNVQCNSGNNESFNAMAVKYDVESGKCNKTLAFWNDMYNVTYLNTTIAWKVEYFNGEICNEDGEHTKFIVNWICTNYSAVDWIVTDVKEINDCAYQMSIESHFAC